jgi:hypothetical protein
LVELVDLRPTGAVAEVAVGDAPQAVVDPVVWGLDDGSQRTGSELYGGYRPAGYPIYL